MKYAIAAVALTAMFSGATLAQNSNSESAIKLSQAECTSIWQKAGGSASTGLTAAQAKPYVADFKSANPDGDATLDQNEFLAACNKGLVKDSSASGASSGTSGSSTGSATHKAK